jgi:hypothetical protein
MLDSRHIVEHSEENTIYIEKSSWIRAKCSGLLHDHNTIGAFVKKGTVLATITDPFGKFEHSKAPKRLHYKCQSFPYSLSRRRHLPYFKKTILNGK